MIRNLIIISAVGLVLAVVGIGGAMAVGGRDLARHEWTWVITEDREGDSNFQIERGAVAPDITRTIEWTGGERLTIDMPGEVTYIQGAQAGITVTGPKTVADRVRIVDGRLTLDGVQDRERSYIRWTRSGIRGWNETEVLRVIVTAPAVKSFDLADHAELEIRHYEQPSLELTLSGSAVAEAQGRTNAVVIDLSGSSRADLEALQVMDARIRASGWSDAKVGPTGAALVDVSGDADVTLTRQPSELRQLISGDGEVTQE